MPRDAPTPLDDFDAKFIDVRGRVLARDKQVGAKGMQAMSLVSVLLFVAGAVALAIMGATVGGGRAAGLWACSAMSLLMAAGFAFGWASLSVLRTAVSSEELVIRCGLWGPRIPIDKIKSCRIATQNGRLSVGKGLRDGMWTSRFLLRTGDYLEVVWTNESGADQQVWFTPKDPQRIAEAIQSARGARVETAARIASDDDEAAEETGLAEEELADEAPRRARR